MNGVNAILAIDDVAGRWSAAAQLGSMFIAGLLGRYVFRSRGMIWCIAFLGAFGAMVAHIMVDGQGAFLLLVYTPIIYLAATAGRDDVGGPHR